jgi:hypothetical protein
MTEDIHMLLGGYILGGLSTEDRHAFDDHLPYCPRCRAELAEAAPLPALLRKVSGAFDLPTAPAGPEPALRSLLDASRARRRRQQSVGWLAAAAAVLIAFGGGTVVNSVTRPDEKVTQARTVTLASSADSPATGKIGVTKKDWGTAIGIQLTDLPRSGVFTLWATDDRGRRELAGTWAATKTGRCALDGATSIATDHLRKVSIIGPDQAVVAVATV